MERWNIGKLGRRGNGELERWIIGNIKT